MDTKVNNQINVISRFRKIVPADVKCKLYKAFIVSYFVYCSAVWHFCWASNKAIQAIQFETMPNYIRGLFQMRNTKRKLPGSRKPVIPIPIR